ncbi:MAG: 50S ribosomal protein L25 [Candidatus Firestonebacteria bacterium]|nr:50S ribosomal protein L25 [Candidatus Firestonebacteria bacterium]
MKQLLLEAQIRSAVGRSDVGRARVAGSVPAVLYGKGETNLNLELVDKKNQSVMFTPGIFNTLIKLTIVGDTPREETVMVKEIQRHPVSEKILHVDFVKISMDRKLETKVPVHLEGTAPGVKEGGILELVHRELHIRCLPAMIPEFISLNISALAIGDAITVAQLPLQEGIEVLVDAHEPIVHVVAPKAEEVKTATDAAAGAPAAGAAAPVAEAKQPEVIGEKEREERRTEKAKKA